MTDLTNVPQQLRASAEARKQATIDRLRQAIAQLEADGRPVNTFTIKEVGGQSTWTKTSEQDPRSFVPPSVLHCSLSSTDILHMNGDIST